MKRLILRCVSVLFVVLGFQLTLATPSQADLTLAQIFSDHMVLQQESKARIWGTADPGQEIIVAFNNQTETGTANAKGQWSVTLATPKAGGPHKLEVTTKNGEPRIVIADVMVGEVWICSGQSNMEWPVQASDNPEKEIDSAKDFPNIRLFTIERNAIAQEQTELGKCRQWSVCSPESVKSFSATAYFFGRALNRELNVPIGLINTSWGGTPAEAWTSMDCLQEDPAFAPLLKRWEENTDLASPHRPANLYNGMIAPLKGIAFRGAIWYQGESNVGRGYEYSKLFPAMIRCWRKHLAEGQNFPFLFVQIAPFRYGNSPPDALAEVWDAQFKTYRTVENAGMIVTTDIGNVHDIHPRNKQDVGERLSKWALHLCYESLRPEIATSLVFSGPIYRDHHIDGSKIRLNFDFTAGELRTRDGQKPTHFMIAGKDGTFVPAEAQIVGETVVVWSPDVVEPVAVRFAWTDTAEPNLINAAGLPASPFRTDDFKLSSQGNSN